MALIPVVFIIALTLIGKVAGSRGRHTGDVVSQCGMRPAEFRRLVAPDLR
jgi:hypothetical protein